MDSSTPAAPSRRSAKIILIGDASVGKTALRSRYLSGSFNAGYRATIGADFIVKTVTLPGGGGQQCALSLWDTAGQERFQALGTSFYRGSDCAIFLYSTVSPPSLASLRKWVETFKARCPVEEEWEDEMCWVAVGTKSDLLDGPSQGANANEDRVEAEEAEALCAELVKHPEPSSDTATAMNGNGDAGPSTLAARRKSHRRQKSSVSTLDSFDEHDHPEEERALASTIDVLPAFTASNGGGLPLPKSNSTRALAKRMSKASAQSIYYTPNSSMRSSAGGPQGMTTNGALSSSLRSELTARPGSSRERDSLAPSDAEDDGPIPIGGRSPTRMFLDSNGKSSPPRAPPSVRHSPSGGQRYINPTDKLLRPPGAARMPGMLLDGEDEEDDGDLDFDWDEPVSLSRGSSRVRRRPSSIAPLSSAYDVGPTSPAPPAEAEPRDTHDYSLDGLKHFRTSAKTGEGVEDVFEYVVRRLKWRWDKEEREGRLERQAEWERIRITEEQQKKKSWRDTCC